jgi:hypothetical protein
MLTKDHFSLLLCEKFDDLLIYEPNENLHNNIKKLKKLTSAIGIRKGKILAYRIMKKYNMNEIELIFDASFTGKHKLLFNYNTVTHWYDDIERDKCEMLEWNDIINMVRNKNLKNY